MTSTLSQLNMGAPPTKPNSTEAKPDRRFIFVTTVWTILVSFGVCPMFNCFYIRTPSFSVLVPSSAAVISAPLPPPLYRTLAVTHKCRTRTRVWLSIEAAAVHA